MSLLSLDIGEHKEIALADINITNKLGIGDFGPIFDAEVRMGTNDIQRAMIKVVILVDRLTI